ERRGRPVRDVRGLVLHRRGAVARGELRRKWAYVGLGLRLPRVRLDRCLLSLPRRVARGGHGLLRFLAHDGRTRSSAERMRHGPGGGGRPRRLAPPLPSALTAAPAARL